MLWQCIVAALPSCEAMGTLCEQEDAQAPDTDFAPNLVNTVCFLVQFLVMLVTFAVNYQARPLLVEVKPAQHSVLRQSIGLTLPSLVLRHACRQQQVCASFSLHACLAAFALITRLAEAGPPLQCGVEREQGNGVHAEVWRYRLCGAGAGLGSRRQQRYVPGAPSSLTAPLVAVQHHWIKAVSSSPASQAAGQFAAALRMAACLVRLTGNLGARASLRRYRC